MDGRFSRKELQLLMEFLIALSHGLENYMGRGANAIVYTAGRGIGKQYSKNAERTKDIFEAVDIVKQELHRQGFDWQFEIWKKEEGIKTRIVKTSGGHEITERFIQLVFRDCMIRQSLFCYGHPQKNSLCRIMWGFFSGAIEKIMGKRAELAVLHPGQNACFKELIWEE
jgi:predicted hydrocarbon binding protein